MMSVLNMYMGQPQKLHISSDGAWMDDNDYYITTGISGEAFGMMYNMQDILASGKFGSTPLDDCFALLGLE